MRYPLSATPSPPLRLNLKTKNPKLRWWWARQWIALDARLLQGNPGDHRTACTRCARGGGGPPPVCRGVVYKSSQDITKTSVLRRRGLAPESGGPNRPTQRIARYNSGSAWVPGGGCHFPRPCPQAPLGIPLHALISGSEVQMDVPPPPATCGLPHRTSCLLYFQIRYHSHCGIIVALDSSEP